MFKSEIVVPQYANLLGWKQHFDKNEIDLPPELTNTDTGEYYQQKHPALRLDIIQTLIPAKQKLNDYLREVVTDSTNEIFNDVLSYRHVNNYGKTLLSRATLLNKYGHLNDTITNQGRFVGFQIRVQSLTGLQSSINEIGLQFAGAESIPMYLFHTSKKDPITPPFTLTATGSGQWDWKASSVVLSAFKAEEYHGGAFILGYYQDALTSNAINYTNFDWSKGECSSCNSSYAKIWKAIRGFYHIHPLYVPAGSFIEGEMFDMNGAVYENTQSWGMNLKLSVECDLTDFFIQNKFVFKNLLAYKVVHKILQMMKFSQEISSIEENIKHMIIRDLEGDVDTKLLNIPTLYYKELKSVGFNIEGINSKCLGCKSDGYAPRYGNV